MPAASANPPAVWECSTSSSPPPPPPISPPYQFKPSFFISECGRIHRYAVVQVQHGHKIKSLGAILNFEQFCDQNNSNLRESPRPEKPRKRRIIIDSGSDVYSLKWAVYRLRLGLKNLNFSGKTALASVRNFCKVLRSCAFFMRGCVFDWHKTCFSLVIWQPANPF